MGHIIAKNTEFHVGGPIFPPKNYISENTKIPAKTLRVVQTEAILFLKIMSEGGGSDIGRL